MNDYKELIGDLRLGADILSQKGVLLFGGEDMTRIADAIEQLVMDKERDDKIIASLQKELVEAANARDAAVADIDKNCGTCKHNYVTPIDYSNCDTSVSNCKWEWRGVQEDDDENA